MTEIHFQSTTHVRLWQTCMKIRKYQGVRELDEYELLCRSGRDISYSPPRAFVSHSLTVEIVISINKRRMDG